MMDFLNDYNLIITIVATLIGIVSSIYTTLNYSSIRKNTTKLLYHPLDSINIYNSLYNGFSGFDIKYNGNLISNNVLYISGELICKGKDIGTIGNEIQVKLPSGYNWIDITVDNKPNISAVATILQTNNQYAIISFDKLMKDKSLTINGILQAGRGTNISVDSIQNSFKFEHNIIKTDDIKIASNNFDSLFSSQFVRFTLTLLAIIIVSFLLNNSGYKDALTPFLGIVLILATILYYVRQLTKK